MARARFLNTARTHRGLTLNMLPSAYKLVSSSSTMKKHQATKGTTDYASAQKKPKAYAFLARTLKQATFSNDHYATIKSKMAFYFKPCIPWLQKG